MVSLSCSSVVSRCLIEFISFPFERRKARFKCFGFDQLAEQLQNKSQLAARRRVDSTDAHFAIQLAGFAAQRSNGIEPNP